MTGWRALAVAAGAYGAVIALYVALVLIVGR